MEQLTRHNKVFDKKDKFSSLEEPFSPEIPITPTTKNASHDHRCDHPTMVWSGMANWCSNVNEGCQRAELKHAMKVVPH